jgi:hypothetical protein
MKRAIYKFLDVTAVPDVKTHAESMVLLDSAALRLKVFLELSLAHDSVSAYTRGIDIAGTPSFSFWSRDSQNSSWLYRQYTPNAILPVDNICP